MFLTDFLRDYYRTHDPEGNLTGQARWHAIGSGFEAFNYCCCTNGVHSLHNWLTLEELARLSLAETGRMEALAENERLRTHRDKARQEELKALEAARVAKGKAALADEAQLTIRELRRMATREQQDVLIRRLRNDWSRRYDALTPAADAVEGGKG